MVGRSRVCKRRIYHGANQCGYSKYMWARYPEHKTAVLLSHHEKQLLEQLGLENSLCCRTSVGAPLGGRNPDESATVKYCTTGMVGRDKLLIRVY